MPLSVYVKMQGVLSRWYVLAVFAVLVLIVIVGFVGC